MSDKREQKPADPMAGIHWDLDKSISYSQYLQLDKVLTAQKPLSGQHDEMLFIVIHQASELWMKLCLHELAATRAQIRADDLEPAFKMLSRVARAQAQLIQSWDVLSTMTPADYMRFRDSLGQSSGFQSWQYRLLEFMLGNKESKLIEVHAKDKAAHALLKQELATPSLYDEALRMLSRRGFDIPKECIGAGLDPALRREPGGRGRLARGVSRLDGTLGPLRARREAGRPRVQVPAMALRAPEDGGADHRIQARHRRLERRRGISQHVLEAAGSSRS